MIFARALLLLLVLFVGAIALVWAASSTPFFNKARLIKIVKWTAIGFTALGLTAIAFVSVVSVDHTF